LDGALQRVEEKHGQWQTSGREGREPEKFHFVKGFHRGVELFGQHTARLDEAGYRDFMQQFGLIVAEGPNDVIALDCLGVPAVGLCSNTATKEQVEKLTKLARGVARGRVVLPLDCDPPGETGAKEALVLPAIGRH
jgi:DNA primase